MWVWPPEEWFDRRRAAGLSVTVGWQLKKQLYGRRKGVRKFNDYVAEAATTKWNMVQCVAQPSFYVSLADPIAMELHQDDSYRAWGYAGAEGYQSVGEGEPDS